MIRFLFSCLLASARLWAQADSRLQLHFVDVGQADSAILISPGGQVAAFDIGRDMVDQNCDRPMGYYSRLGIRKIDYLFISHYHEDHIGCVANVLDSVHVDHVEDRGHSYASTYYDEYARATAGKRTTARVGDRIILDEASPTPVVIDVYAVNGNGKYTSNENDRSLAVLITYGGFRAEIGGDLSGSNQEDYTDVESGMAAAVGKLDLYKVHHHCSSFSSNQTWLAATMPTVAIISAGVRNEYGHPAVDCVERLHHAGTEMYWTERGNGAVPLPGWDTISGTTVVGVDLGAMQYTLTYGNSSNVYSIGRALQDTSYFTRTSFPF